MSTILSIDLPVGRLDSTKRCLPWTTIQCSQFARVLLILETYLSWSPLLLLLRSFPIRSMDQMLILNRHRASILELFENNFRCWAWIFTVACLADVIDVLLDDRSLAHRPSSDLTRNTRWHEIVLFLEPKCLRIFWRISEFKTPECYTSYTTPRRKILTANCEAHWHWFFIFGCVNCFISALFTQ